MGENGGYWQSWSQMLLLHCSNQFPLRPLFEIHVNKILTLNLLTKCGNKQLITLFIEQFGGYYSPENSSKIIYGRRRVKWIFSDWFLTCCKSCQKSKSVFNQQGKSEGFESCDRPSNLKQTNWIQIVNFLARVTLKFHGWPWKTIGHLFHTTSSFVHHFKSISEFKLGLGLQSGNAQIGLELPILSLVQWLG